MTLSTGIPNNWHKVSLTLGLILILSGCATMFTGSYDNVKVTSTPPGAQVTIDGEYKGVTPVTAALKRDQDHNISIHKDGHPDASQRVTRRFNYVSLVNTINPLCWGADIITGAVWKFEETQFDVDLSARTPAPTSK